MRRDGSREKPGLFAVIATITPDREDAFNAWYDEDHLPKAVARLPGIVSGRRYKIVEGGEGYQYMALYEFESYEALEAALASDALKGLIREYDEAFGQGGRKWLKAIRLKALTVE